VNVAIAPFQKIHIADEIGAQFSKRNTQTKAPQASSKDGTRTATPALHLMGQSSA
jgi:hypothetical protein